jgi:phosphate transport system permease protein
VTPPLAPGTPAGQEPLLNPSSPKPAIAGRRRGVPGLSLGRVVPYIPALIPAAIVAAIVWQLLVASGLSIYPLRGPMNFGWEFLGPKWNQYQNEWGIAVFIVGSFITAVPALFLSLFIGLGIAIASTTYLPKFLANLLDPVVDLLAGIPSVVYGIWAYLVVAPYFGTQLNPWLYNHAGFIPFFGNPSPPVIGTGLPLGIFILTIMALPITTLLIRDAFRAFPKDLWESGLALGATRWETMRRVAIPHSSRSILSAGLLGFGRAFSETVALAMILGVQAAYPASFYQETATLATWMFEYLDDAYVSQTWLAALSEMALILLAVSLIVNILGRRLVSSFIAYDVAGL